MKAIKISLCTSFLFLIVLSQVQSQESSPKNPSPNFKVKRSVDTKPDGSEVLREKIFYENGSVWLESNLSEDGTIHKWTYYYKTGNPYWSAMTVNEKLNSQFIHWYDNGQVAEIIEFSNNAENGKAIFYYPNGQVAMEGKYREGKMVGEWKFFNEDGTSINKGLWSWLFFDSAELRMQGRIKRGKMEGHWEYTETANADKPYRRQYYLEYENGELIQ